MNEKKLVFMMYVLILIALTVTGCKKENIDDPSQEQQPQEQTESRKPKKEEVVIVEEPKEPEVFDIDPLLDMREADLASYDGTVLSGTQAHEVLKLFKNSNLAILVATQSVMDGTEAINQLDGNVDAETPTAGAKGIDGLINTSGESLTETLTFVNYGAVLKQGDTDVVLEYKENYLHLDQDFKATLDTVEVNQNILRTDVDGYAENMADYLYFQSNLIKDKSDKTIGIALYAVKVQ